MRTTKSELPPNSREFRALLREYTNKVYIPHHPWMRPKPHNPKGRVENLTNVNRTKLTQQERDFMQEYAANYNWLGQAKTTNWMPFGGKPITSIDGEGMTLEDGEHIYTLLAAHSEEENVCTSVEPRSKQVHGLSTRQCFRFLLDLPSDTVKIGFAINYDINMMLKDVPKHNLKELAESGETCWEQYKIVWYQGKSFRIIEYADATHYISQRTRMVRMVQVWDVFPFFQKSFVTTLEEWKIGDPAIVAEILEMKNKRADFNNESPEEVKAYCYREVELLSQLGRKLLAMCQRVDIRIKRLDGAGAVASAILEKYDVRRYLEPTVNGRSTLPKEIFDIGLRAYYGGRFDIRSIGYFSGTLWEYDIRSAYPDQMRNLPCLACGHWEARDDYNPGTISVHEVDWNVYRKDDAFPDRNQTSGFWPPFPFRGRTGNIHFPANGKGWYYSVEIDSARRLHPGNAIRVGAGWEFVRPDDCRENHRPFDFVPYLYEERNRLKATGDFSQIILKLGLNALYGKTAQSIGHAEKKPPCQSFIWAGMITAGTRAKIMDGLAQDPAACISVATDAIISTKPLDLPLTESLGDWEFFPIDDLLLLQSGFMTYTRKGERKWKRRGFAMKAIDLEKIEKAFNSDGKVELVDTRFIGLMLALQRSDWTIWRRWIPVPKTIELFPEVAARGLLGLELLQSRGKRSGKHFDMVPLPMSLIRTADDGMSLPYQLKSNWQDAYTDPRSEDKAMTVLLGEQP